jgi:hypothetical protein
MSNCSVMRLAGGHLQISRDHGNRRRNRLETSDGAVIAFPSLYETEAGSDMMRRNHRA